MTYDKKRLVCGKGINDADYVTQKYNTVEGKRVKVWICPFYNKWTKILQRCYSTSYKKTKPSYQECEVCEEWLTFSNFKAWMETQNWEGKELDKDLLFDNNKIYSPKTCLFIPNNLNTFLITNAPNRGKLPLGVKDMAKSISDETRSFNRYSAQCSNRTKFVHLGVYKHPLEAHLAYLTYKLKMCEDYIEEYKFETKLIEGLIRVKTKIKDHIEHKRELKHF